jgi:hypothetical protein
MEYCRLRKCGLRLISNWLCYLLRKLSGDPVIWCSKLQTEITLSTAEDKYIAMSHVLHETIPIQNLIKEIHCIFDLPNPMTMTDFNITLHEDNLSAIEMAESLKFTPRTKHIAIKYHHFHSQVNSLFNKSGDIKLK